MGWQDETWFTVIFSDMHLSVWIAFFEVLPSQTKGKFMSSVLIKSYYEI